MRGPEPAPKRSPLTRLRDLRARDRPRRKQVLIEGVKLLVAAVDAGWRFEALIVSRLLLRDPLGQQLVRRLQQSGVPCQRVTPEVFREISRMRRASGVAAIVREHWTPLARADPAGGLCWVAVRQLRSPGNFGTILRTCEAVGAAGVFVLGDGVDPFDAGTVRASTGAVFRQTLVRTEPETLRRWAEQNDCTIVGACPSAKCPLHESSFKPRTVLLLGEEGRGLEAVDRALCRAFVRIPVVGNVDSLNVATAASLVLYEIFRSRAIANHSRADRSQS